MNCLIRHIIEKHLEARGIQDYRIEDNVFQHTGNAFTLRKGSNEILFVYKQQYTVRNGYYGGEVKAELLSEPRKLTVTDAMLVNGYADTVFVAESDIDVRITANVEITSVFQYITIIPL